MLKEDFKWSQTGDTIPRDEYLRLKALEEDLSDLQSVSEVLKRLEMGEEELLPSFVVDQLLDGKSPLLVWRKQQNLTQAELARRSKVNRVQIIDIEAGRKTGSVTTLSKLAVALKICIDDLVSLAISSDVSCPTSGEYDTTPRS